jgi:hypothetical protein
VDPPFQTVTYPTLSDFKRYSREVLEKLDESRHNVSYVREKRDVNEDDLRLLRDIQSRDPLAEISEQEKSTVRVPLHHFFPSICSSIAFGRIETKFLI